MARKKVFSDINITPLTDIFLVLLTVMVIVVDAYNVVTCCLRVGRVKGERLTAGHVQIVGGPVGYARLVGRDVEVVLLLGQDVHKYFGMGLQDVVGQRGYTLDAHNILIVSLLYYICVKDNNRMKKWMFLAGLACLMLGGTAYSQVNTKVSYQQAVAAPAMEWVCPEADSNRKMLDDLEEDNFKDYALNLKSKVGLSADPDNPADKYILVQAIITTGYPKFDSGHLLVHIR